MKKIIIHIFYAFATLLLLISFFFYFILPSTINKKIVKVPDIENIPIHQAKKILIEHNLKAEIKTENFYAKYFPPNTVLKQYPHPYAEVKKYRKIYVTINPSTLPHIQMPDLQDLSLKNAKIALNHVGLLLGNIVYVPDIAQNVVIKQMYQNKKIQPNTPIKMGEKIDLIVGKGLSKKYVLVPNIIGIPLEKAKTILNSLYLILGKITYECTEEDSLEQIVHNQDPQKDTIVTINSSIDVWVNECT